MHQFPFNIYEHIESERVEFSLLHFNFLTSQTRTSAG